MGKENLDVVTHREAAMRRGLALATALLFTGLSSSVTLRPALAKVEDEIKSACAAQVAEDLPGDFYVEETCIRSETAAFYMLERKYRNADSTGRGVIWRCIRKWKRMPVHIIYVGSLECAKRRLDPSKGEDR
jgi:hypothetical protein